MFFFKQKKSTGASFYKSPEAYSAVSEIVSFGNLDRRQRDQTDLPKLGLREFPYLKNDVVHAYDHRCAFCEERRKDVEAYQYRPAGHAEPADSRDLREYYFWLSLSWQNLYPICPSCRPDYELYFPIREGQRVRPSPAIFKTAQYAVDMDGSSRGSPQMAAVLEAVTRLFFEGAAYEEDIRSQKYFDEEIVINDGENDGVDLSALRAFSAYSTRDQEMPVFHEPGRINNPENEYQVDIHGVLSPTRPFDPEAPLSSQSRAGATLAHFKLNAPETVDKRRRVFDTRLETLRTLAQIEGAFDRENLFDFDNMDFGSAWYLLLAKIGPLWSERVNGPERFDLNSLRGSFETLCATGAGRELDEVLSGLRNPPDGGQEVHLESAADPAIATASRPATERPVRPVLKAAGNAKIRAVEIRNFKALEALEIRMPQNRVVSEKTGRSAEPDASPCLLVLGENACGKSSILEAIAIACADSAAFSELKIDHQKLVLNPRYMGLRGAETGTRTGGQEDRRCEICVRLENGTDYRTTFSRSSSFEREIRPAGGDWRPVGPDDGLDLFAFGAHRLYGAKTRNSGSVANICTLFDNTKLLADPEDWLIDLHDRDREALDEVVAQLRKLISIDGDFKSIEIVADPDRPEQRICEMRIVKEPVAGEEASTGYIVHMPLSAVSSGYRTIIALFCDILSGLLAAYPDEELNYRLIRKVFDTPCTVMIDEIEAHLHPRWKLQVVKGLRQVLKNAYFILTSHDPLCIRGMENDEVHVLNRGANPVTGTEADVLERVDIQAGQIKTELFTVEQLLTSSLFNLMTTESGEREIRFAKMIETPEDRAELEEEIARALPIGDSVAIQLIQEAVRDYLAQSNGKVQNSEARKEAIRKIKAHLKQAKF